MMFVDNALFDDGNTARLSLSMIGAFVIHAAILLYIFAAPSQTILVPDMLSAPTNVSIRFVTPVRDVIKPVPDVVKKAAPQKQKPVVKKRAKIATSKPVPDVLNDIAPAAAPPQAFKPVQTIQMTQSPVPLTIPVVSEASLKGRRVQPTYPARALRLRQEGVILLRVLISETGARQDLKLHKPSQYALLNQAAIKAVKKWTFDPNVVNGRAVKSWVEVPIEFKIQ